MKNRNLRYIYNVIGLAVIMFLALREFLSAVVLKINFAPDSLPVYFVAMAVFVAAVLIPTITVENMLGLHPKLFGKTDPAKTAAAVAYSYLLIIGAVVVNAAVLMVFSGMGLEFRPVELTVPDGFFKTLLYLVYVSVLPAVLEEIFVRGYILNALRGFGTTFAVIFSSVCFALMHSRLDSFLVYFACGILLAQLYLTFDSLLPCMALHFVNNTISYLLTVFRGRANAVSVLGMIIFVYTAAIIFGIAGKKYLDKTGTNLRGWFVRGSDVGRKLAFVKNSYAAVAALCLLVFFAALGSWNSLV